MSDDNVADATLLGVAKRDSDAAGVNGDAVVDDKAGKALRETGAAL
jgi:hypothetical protein